MHNDELQCAYGCKNHHELSASGLQQPEGWPRLEHTHTQLLLCETAQHSTQLCSIDSSFAALQASTTNAQAGCRCSTLCYRVTFRLQTHFETELQDLQHLQRQHKHCGFKQQGLSATKLIV